MTSISMSEVSSNGSVYELSGPADAPVIVLIHGLGLNRHVWDSYASRLAHRYRVLNYDLFGHGESFPPPGIPSLTLFSEQLLGLLDELAIDRCAMIGFSLGGMINRRFAMDHPERLRALAILNSPHEREPEAQKLVEQRALDSASYALCRQVLAFGVVELIRPQPPITHPTLIMTCENDSGSTPAMSQSIASEITGSQVIVVPGLKHMGLAENPSFFISALMDFLEELADT
jgi:pimeloyl-ACP methyl ester carboxylesterase